MLFHIPSATFAVRFYGHVPSFHGVPRIFSSVIGQVTTSMMSLQNLQAGLRFSHGCCCLMISTPKSTSLKQKDHLQIGDLISFDEILFGWPWNRCSFSFMGYMLLLCLFCWWNFRVSLSTTPPLEPLLRGAVSHHRTTLCKSITSIKFLRIHLP